MACPGLGNLITPTNNGDSELRKWKRNDCDEVKLEALKCTGLVPRRTVKKANLSMKREATIPASGKLESDNIGIPGNATVGRNNALEHTSRRRRGGMASCEASGSEYRGGEMRLQGTRRVTPSNLRTV